MAVTLSSTQIGSSPDYYRYVSDAVTKTDRMGDPDILDFTVLPTDGQFVRLSRGAYIKASSEVLKDNQGTIVDWFTGYITNDPEYDYLGVDSITKKPAFGYKYEAQSDECILSQQSLGISKPFINMTQGQILASIADQLLPGMFDTSGIQDGLFLARYIVDPTKTYQDIIKEFSTSAVYRFWGRNKKLYYTPQDDAQFSAGISPTTIDRNDKHFTPANLSIRATQQGIINDAIVLGATEPREYVTEYFSGDGSNALFPLMNSAFGVESALLLDDDFSSGQIDSSKWTVYDSPSNFMQVSNGYLNILGGDQNGTFDVHLDSANLIPVAGNIKITHGDFEFIDAGQPNGVLGVVGALWTQEPNPSLTGCVYGIKVTKAGGVTTLAEIVNGLVSTTNTQTVDFAKTYVIRTNLSASRINRALQSFTYLDAAGNLQSVSVPVESYPDQVSFTTYISEIDAVAGTLDSGYPRVWNSSVSLAADHATFANYVLVASDNLHLTVTDTTISTPLQAILEINKAIISPTAQSTVTLTGTVVTTTENPTGTVTFKNDGVIIGSATVSNGVGILVIAASSADGALSATFSPTGATAPGVVTVVSSPASSKTFQTGTEYAQQIIGPNEVDSLDGLTPVATITQSGGVTKSTTLGTPKYQAGNPTLSFFKNSNNLTSTVPGVGDLIRLKYRQAGASIARVRDQVSVNEEAASWGDSGIRSVTRSDLSPQPTTSSECEAAAAAIIFEAARPRFEGSYKVTSPYTTVEPLAGMVLPFKNMPVETFTETNFAEMIYEVKSTLLSIDPELYQYDVSYGKATDQLRLQAVLSRIDQQPDVFAPEDSAEIPNYVAPNSVGSAWSPDLLYLSISGMDATNIYLTAPSPLPTGAGIEVRSSDSSWGCDNSRNLIGRFTTQTFAVPRNAHNKAVFARMYDTRNKWAWSEDLAQMGTTSPGAPLDLVTAVNPDGHLSRLTRFIPNGSFPYVDFTSSIAVSGPGGCFSINFKGDAGETFSVGSNVTSLTTLTCNGAWQRVSLPFPTGTGGGTVTFRIESSGTVLVCRASVEVGTTAETVFCKTNGVPYGALSRYASAVRVNLPLVPPPPTAKLTFLDISDPVVTLTLPTIALDVWGFEIRGSDNATVIEHQDIADVGVNPSLAMPQVHDRSVKYYCYTYNLLGEYSPACAVEFQVPNPTLGEVVIQDKTKMLEWDSTNSKGVVLLIDTVDSTFTHLVVNQVVTGNFFQLSDAEFFESRWFKLTPYDDLGTGNSVIAEHSYLPDAVTALGSNEVGVIVAPASGTGTITVPTQFQKYGSEYSTIAYAMYKRNTSG
jgi:hypothetical protein